MAETRIVTVQDIERLTERQRDVLGLVCINQDTGHHPATLAALERRGLIVGRFQTLGAGTSLEVVVQRWSVPLAVHVAWCAWCSEQEEVADG